MKRLITFIGAITLCVCFAFGDNSPMVVAGNMKIAASGTMKSNGPVYVNAATTTQGIIVNEGTLNIGNDGIVFYSNNTKDGMLLTKGNGTVTAPTANPEKVKVRKTLDKDRWYPISFPFKVRVSDIKKSNGETPTYGPTANFVFIEYDSQNRANTGTIGTNWKYINDAATILEKGKGYMIGANDADLELVFPACDITNLFDYDDKSVTIIDYIHSDPNKVIHYPKGRGWNYIGGLNLCYFDLNHTGFKFERTTNKGDGWNGTIYYSSDGEDFTNVFTLDSDVDRNISPFLPFLIQSGGEGIDKEDGLFTFKKEGLNVGITSQNPLRSSKMSEKDIFSLTLTGNDLSDKTYIVLGDNHKDDYFISEDAVKLSSPELKVWSVIDNSTSLFVNALSRVGAKEIPLGVSVPEKGEYLFDFSAIDRNNSIESAVLLDKENGTKTDVLMQPYSFETDGAINTNDRFVLYINQTVTAIDRLDTYKVYAYANNGVLTVKNLKDKDNVQVLDVSGRVITSGVAQNNEYSTPLANKGVYIVNVRGEKNTVIKVLNK